MKESVTELLANYKHRLLEEKRRLGMHQDENANADVIENATKHASTAEQAEPNDADYRNSVETLKAAARSSGQCISSDQEETDTPSLEVHDSKILPMLRRGEYSPTTSIVRNSTQPYLGFGEYEARREKFLQERQADLKDYLDKQKRHIPQKLNKRGQRTKLPKIENNGTNGKQTPKYVTRNLFLESKPVYSGTHKGVQTDLQGIENRLVQCSVNNEYPAEKELSPRRLNVPSDPSDVGDDMSDNSRANQLAVKIDKVQIGTQNNIIVPGQEQVPSSVPSHGILRDNSPRARLLADLKHSYYPSFYDTARLDDDAELLKMNRIKWERARQREEYQEDLRKQIEEKQKQALESAERERREEEALTRRLEKQLQQLKAERERDEAKRMARETRLRLNTEEFIRKQREYQNDIEQEKRFVSHSRGLGGMDSHFTNRSEPTTINRRSQLPFYNSPPLPSHRSRPPYSFNIPQTSVFANTLPVRKYNEPYLSMRDDKSSDITKVQISDLRNTGGIGTNKTLEQIKYRPSEDLLPIPVLRAKSPVAESLKYSSVVDSHAPSSAAMRQVEAKWKIPAVQKNIVTRSDALPEGRNRNVLTQLGAIRLQLQQEQMRLDQTLQQKVASNATRTNVNRL